MKKVNDTTEKPTYRVPEYNMAYLETRIGRLNKMADKLGCTPITINILKEEMYPDPKDKLGLRQLKIYTLEVNGQAPVLEGWSFAGTLQHFEGGNIIRALPDETIPDTYRTSPVFCDHCQTRRRRKDTFIVRTEDGEYKQIGRQCLKDFLGHTNPEKIASFASLTLDIINWLEEDDENDHSGGKANTYYHFDAYLKYVAACIEELGWLSRGQAKEEQRDGATADLALHLLGGWGKKYDSEHDKNIRYNVKTKQYPVVQQALEWIRTNPPTPNDSTYIHNLKIACMDNEYHCFVVQNHTSGLIASLIPAYQKAMEIEIKRAERLSSDSKSEWFGEVGEKFKEKKMLVTLVKELQNDWGCSNMHKLVDENGNIGIWFSSTQHLEQGEWYTIKGRVKEHKYYSPANSDGTSRTGIYQTVLTRCKATKIE